MTKPSSECRSAEPVECSRIEVFSGYVRHGGVRIQVDFELPFGSSAIEKDAAFLAAMAQKVEFDYLALGERATEQGVTE